MEKQLTFKYSSFFIKSRETSPSLIKKTSHHPDPGPQSWYTPPSSSPKRAPVHNPKNLHH